VAWQARLVLLASTRLDREVILLKTGRYLSTTYLGQRPVHHHTTYVKCRYGLAGCTTAGQTGPPALSDKSEVSSTSITSLETRPSGGALAERPTNGHLSGLRRDSLTFTDSKSRSTHPVHAKLQGLPAPCPPASCQRLFSLCFLVCFWFCVRWACEIA